MSLAVSERNTTRWANALKSLKQGVSRRVIRDAEHFWQKVVLRFQHSQSLAVCGKAALHSRQAGKSGRRDGPEDWPWSSFLRYATGAEGRVEIESEWTARKRERAAGGLCPAVELPHSSQHRVLSGPARQVNELFSSLYNGEDGTIGSELIAMEAEPQESDLLVAFEIRSIPDDYREYYRAKRQNLFATIQRFPEVWRCYLLLDKLFLREFEDLKTATDPARMFPLILFFNAHAKMRVSIELAFSGCLPEARSLLRDSIESMAHAHTMLSDVILQKIWLNKHDGQSALEQFKNAFERNKKVGIFKGLDELHSSWGRMSETGAHSTVTSICERFLTVDSGCNIEWRLTYCGLELTAWEKSIFELLLICSTMERTLFGDYEWRLKLDDRLARMRLEFQTYKEQVRQNLINRHNIPAPVGKSLLL
jgi:hypothetical protein